MDEFQEKLAALRKVVGISQSELARRVGLSPSYIHRLENGERRPTSRDVVLNFAQALDLDGTMRDELLLSGGFAREADRNPEPEHRLQGLTREFVRCDNVTARDIDTIEMLMKGMMQRDVDEETRSSASNATEAGADDAD